MNHLARVEEISTGYQPRPFQQKIHRRLKRFNVLVCHRRFGKTVMAINELIDQALRCELKNPQYFYLAPTYAQAKRIAWQYLKDYTQNLPNVSTNEQELRLTIDRPAQGDRITFYLLGAEHYDAHRGLYWDGGIFDEYGDMHPDAWSKVFRPALADRMGWAIFIGTPKGQNHFYDIYYAGSKLMAADKDWFVATFKASETGVVPEAELQASRESMSKDEYEQEFECSFNAALTGAYFNTELAEARESNRVRDFIAYDRALPVITSWDLGINDTTCIWFAQVYDREVRFIDYMEVSGIGLPKIVPMVLEKPYFYERHYLPHDAAARSLDTGVTRVETMAGLGMKRSTMTVVQRQHVPDRINASRVLLHRAYFSSSTCEQGLNALANYQRGWDEKKKVFSDTPLHNWASNGADSFGYMALGLGINLSYNNNTRDLPQEADGDFDIF